MRSEPSRPRRLPGVLAVLALCLGILLSACTSGTGGNASSNSTPTTAAGTSASGSSVPGSSASGSVPTKPKSTPPGKPVHVSLFQGDGQTYGVGMAVIAQFDVAPATSRYFTKVVTVTVDGKPSNGSWFFQKSNNRDYRMEALYRERSYWKPHARIHVNLPLKGVSAGPGLTFANSLTLDMNTGAANISTVEGEHMRVMSDGKFVRQLPVSLGAASTPTYSGKKVVMEKKNPQHMTSEPGDPEPYALNVPWSVRVTGSGEFIHAASWNTGNIGSRNTSHGCTNLTVANAQWFYNFARIGDVVLYPSTDGKPMPSWDGFGWWNLGWSQWLTGGELKNHGTEG
jgi:lipoprotein-anchoring transpeptidase ErfK/SrfK